jgi:putative Holliday junction resolvase
MKYLGIDFGTKRIGLAVSDEGGVLAFPHKVVSNNREALERIAQIVTEQHIEAIVMGESRTYSGEDNLVMHDARQFAELLSSETGKKICWHTEVLTSQLARRGDEKNARPVARKRAGAALRAAPIDDSAAAIILQSFLDSGAQR